MSDPRKPTGSVPARRSWLHEIPPPVTETTPRLFESDMPTMPGFRDAVYGWADWMTERIAAGSRWFGPVGYFNQARLNRDNELAPAATGHPAPQNFGQPTLAMTNQGPAPVAFPAQNGHAGFAPSRQQQVAEGLLPDAPRAPYDTFRALSVSLNYRGDINVAENLSADIPEDENCSFWIRRLPTNTTVATLLAAVRGIGRVYCTVITPPSPGEGWHTAAAKLVFFELKAARRFWDRYGREGQQQLPFVVGGMRAIVERNRIRTAQSDHPRDRSRVVCVSGAEAVADVNALLREFESNFVFQIDQVLVTSEVRRIRGDIVLIRHIEFRFGSFRCQAQNAYRLLYGREGLTVRYGRDPCDL